MQYAQARRRRLRRGRRRWVRRSPREILVDGVVEGRQGPGGGRDRRRLPGGSYETILAVSDGLGIRSGALPRPLVPRRKVKPCVFENGLFSNARRLFYQRAIAPAADVPALPGQGRQNLHPRRHLQAGARERITVSSKGGVSVYGLGRFPITLYQKQWLRLPAMGDAIRQFIVDHKSELKVSSK